MRHLHVVARAWLSCVFVAARIAVCLGRAKIFHAVFANQLRYERPRTGEVGNGILTSARRGV